MTARVSTVDAAPDRVNTTVDTATSSLAVAVAVSVAPGRTDGPGVTPVRVSEGGASRTRWIATGVVDAGLPAASVATA